LRLFLILENVSALLICVDRQLRNAALPEESNFFASHPLVLPLIKIKYAYEIAICRFSTNTVKIEARILASTGTAYGWSRFI
jgi:hypothetical protein